MRDFSFDAIDAIICKMIYITMVPADLQILDLTHDIRHLCTR